MILNIPYKFNPMPYYKTTTPPAPDYGSMPLTIKNIGNGSVSINFDKQYSYSKNGGEWTTLNTGTNVSLENTDDWVQISGTQTSVGSSSDGGRNMTHCNWSGTGKVIMYGNPQSMVNWGPVIDYCFSKAFRALDGSKNQNIVDVSNVVISAASVGIQGCRQMFMNCQALTAAPAILPAMNLSKECYQGMFSTCANLIKGPSLPATTLARDCYSWMFINDYMLSSIEVNFTNWTQATDITLNWMQNVQTNGGTFTKPASLPTERGVSRIPSNWTVVDK